MRKGQWIGGVLLAIGSVGFLFVLALLCRAYLYQREDELGFSTDFTLRGPFVCTVAGVVATPGWFLVFLPPHPRQAP